jgi:hydroxylamine reductase (hybrid-cluster protein)
MKIHEKMSEKTLEALEEEKNEVEERMKSVLQEERADEMQHAEDGEDEKDEKNEKSETITETIKKNYRKTAAVITAGIGETILKCWSVLIFCIKIGLDGYSMIFFLATSLTPYLTIIVNSLFKGETKDVEVQNQILKERLKMQEVDSLQRWIQTRDYYEVVAQLAARDGKVPDAIKATNNWFATNEILKINK